MGLEFIAGFAILLLAAVFGIAYWINGKAAKALPGVGKLAQEAQQLPANFANLPKYVQDLLAQKNAMVAELPSAIEAIQALQIVNRRLAAVNAKETDPQYVKEVNSLAAQLIKEPVA